VITEPLLSQLVKQYDLPVSTSSKGDGRGGGGKSKVVVYDCNDSSLSAAKAVGMGTFDVRSVFDFPTDTLVCTQHAMFAIVNLYCVLHCS